MLIRFITYTKVRVDIHFSVSFLLRSLRSNRRSSFDGLISVASTVTVGRIVGHLRAWIANHPLLTVVGGVIMRQF